MNDGGDARQILYSREPKKQALWMSARGETFRQKDRIGTILWKAALRVAPKEQNTKKLC